MKMYKRHHFSPDIISFRSGCTHQDAANFPVPRDSLTTAKLAADKMETMTLMLGGLGSGQVATRARAVGNLLRNGPWVGGQKAALKLNLPEKDRGICGAVV